MTPPTEIRLAGIMAIVLGLVAIGSALYLWSWAPPRAPWTYEKCVRFKQFALNRELNDLDKALCRSEAQRRRFLPASEADQYQEMFFNILGVAVLFAALVVLVLGITIFNGVAVTVTFAEGLALLGVLVALGGLYRPFDLSRWLYIVLLLPSAAFLALTATPRAREYLHRYEP